MEDQVRTAHLVARKTGTTEIVGSNPGNVDDFFLVSALPPGLLHVLGPLTRYMV